MNFRGGRPLWAERRVPWKTRSLQSSKWAKIRQYLQVFLFKVSHNQSLTDELASSQPAEPFALTIFLAVIGGFDWGVVSDQERLHVLS